MPTYTRDEVLKRIQNGERLDRADLSGLDLSKTQMAKALLDRADLDGANLGGTNLSKASLRRASLREAYLIGADLSGANLENADLEGAKLDRANLAGANLTRANLEGAVLTGANLAGAQLSFAQLGSAKLGNANLTDTVLSHAELDEAYLGAVTGPRARFANASLVGANLEGAQLPGASFDEATLEGAQLRNVDLSGGSLFKTDFSSADLSGANLTGTDIRHATFARAVITGARLTGAKAAGLVGTGRPSGGVEVTWLDLSPAGDGSGRVENGVIPSVLSMGALAAASPSSSRPPVDDHRGRYFGKGDVLRNAILQFDAGARVEIDSLFQNCTLNLADQTELVIGASGVLADCEIIGPGRLTIHGKFFERKSPGIVGPRLLSVSAQGAVVSSIAQNPESTRFSFDSGCQLRIKIVSHKPQPTDKTEVT